jgi:hypothetical protein
MTAAVFDRGLLNETTQGKNPARRLEMTPTAFPSRTASALVLSAAFMASGCATTGAGSLAGTDAADPAASIPATPAVSTPPTADRQAILSMVGEFGVTFVFEETVALAADYERFDPKRTGAAETVVLVEDSGDRIVLQHLLLVGDSVVKHWRQDWIWEAEYRFEFTDDQTWTRVPLSAEQTRGQWTQCVFEVSDAPRYCGTGAWNHRYGNATWTSDRSWRPLPRRDYTIRDDYTALNVENRHTITPTGWTHEQDNSKVVRVDGETREVLVREFGFNNYIRTDRTDFSAAYAYWDETSAYWAEVRDAWTRMLENGGVVLDTEVDGMPVIDGLFELADAAREGEAIDPARIDAVFDAHVIPVGRQLADD